MSTPHRGGVPSVALPPGGAWDAARWRALVDALPGDALGAWLAERRWSGMRGERLGAVRVTAVVALPTVPPAAWLVVEAARGTASSDARVRWQVPLLLAPGAAADAASVVAEARGETGERWTLSDAPLAASFRDALHRALAAGASLAGDGAEWRAEPIGGGATWAGGATPPSRVSAAEQSNTSIVYGDVAILKLFRRLERGEQPDVEVTRFLTRVGFPHTPPLLATLRVNDAQGSSVAGMLQRFLPGSADAWAYALDAGRRDLRGDGAPAFAADARALGTVTRALHDALASDAADPAFSPQAARRDDVARWAAAARRSVDEGLALLAERLRDGAVAASVAGEASRLAERAGAVRDVVDALAERVSDDAGAMIRHHGDYHLGQVLRTPDGAWWIIDFEGEPSRPLDERRARHCPLRDVAGMLRSFAYAAATIGADGDDARRARAAEWEGAARGAFLDGYAGAGSAPFLSRADASRAALVALFELEKLFYELAYELRNRPDWTWIPLAGIARAME